MQSKSFLSYFLAVALGAIVFFGVAQAQIVPLDCEPTLTTGQCGGGGCPEPLVGAASCNIHIPIGVDNFYSCTSFLADCCQYNTIKYLCPTSITCYQLTGGGGDPPQPPSGTPVNVNCIGYGDQFVLKHYLMLRWPSSGCIDPPGQCEGFEPEPPVDPEDE